MLNQLKSAFITLTRLPFIKIDDEDFDLKNSLWAFPIVGLVLAGLTSLVISILCALDLPPLAATILAVLALILLTGALHEDGLADCADALGGSSQERRLEIMRDSQIGAYGTLALIFSVGLRSAALYLLWLDEFTFFALLISLATARAAMVIVPFLAKPAREDGLAAEFKNIDIKQLVISQVIVLVSGLFLIGTDVIFLIIFSFIACYFIAQYATKKIGGFTGDVLGATEQIVQAICLLTILALI